MPILNKLVSHHRTNLDHMNYYYFKEGFCEDDVNKIHKYISFSNTIKSNKSR